MTSSRLRLLPIPTFQLRLFGQPSLRDNAGQVPPGLGWGKPLALLALLAVRREVRRDEVVDLLWRGVAEDKARNAFRQALHRLRSAVGDDVLPQDRERLRLVPGQSLDIDLDRFESAMTAGRLTDALDACAGEFLEKASLGEPPFDMWMEQERARLRARVAQLLGDAIGQASAAGRWAEAVARSNRLMSITPFETSSAQLAATTLISAGRRHEARELLKQFAVTLNDELGLPLPAELQSLLARIDRQAGAESTAQAGQSSARVAIPFAGREAELSQLVTLCRTTAEESGGFALIKGEPGMGKSRLLAELVAHLRSLGRITVLHGREHAAGVQLPYAVFAEALRPLVRAQGVVGASRHLLAEAARLLPELRDEMELPAVSDVEDEAGRLRFFEGIAALMDSAAFERPIVLVVDDVHLAGPSTLELLSYLCARLSRSAVTFVYAIQPSATPASMLTRLEAIARSNSQTHEGRSLSLELGPLNRDAAHRAVSQLAGANGVSEAVVDRVVSQAEGVPATLVELARRVIRGEAIVAAPVSLREIVVDRVARLTSVQRRLLFVIALMGRPTLRSVAGDAAHLPDAAVADALDSLTSEGLVDARADGFVEIDESTRQTALDLAGPSTRAFLSGWIADELAARSAAPGELARFFAAAGQSRPAFEQSRLAAFAALRVGATPEATHHLQVARTFAPSPAELAKVESLLAAIGAGHRQIAFTPAAPSDAVPPAAEPTPGGSMPSRRLASLFPNWRILLGGAVATLVITALVLADRALPSGAQANLPTGDTLLVEDAGLMRIVTGDMARGFTVGPRRPPAPRTPAWIDSLERPWSNPITAPRNQRVAVERVGQSGSDIFIISADRRDTTPLLVNAGDAHVLGWSPDGRWLLAAVSAGTESFDAQLLALSEFSGRVEHRVIDPAPRRTVVEAAWSPDGTRIAWVSRVGDERQLEVFVADADGSGIRNVSRHPADDQHIAWSPDGKLLAFTSTRDGNAELYAQSFLEDRLWRLTSDPAQDDGARFSSDGRLLAFESTRGGAAGAYVMPALGGEARRLDARAPVSVLRWHGGTARYVDRIVIEQPGRILRGDTVIIRAAVLDQFDEPLIVTGIQWRILDSAVARAVDASDDQLRVTASGAGVARVVASVGGWRFDTALVALGSGTVHLLRSDEPQQQFWRALGNPRPSLSGNSIRLLSDREWDSGVLSRDVVPLLPGLVLQAVLQLPLSGRLPHAASVSVAYVAPEDTTTIDVASPQFLRYATLGWNAESGRLIYAVGREFFNELVPPLLADSGLPVQIRVEQDSTVSFLLAGQQRWRSSLRVIPGRQSARAQIWISSRATGDRARISKVAVRIEPSPSNP